MLTSSIKLMEKTKYVFERLVTLDPALVQFFYAPEATKEGSTKSKKKKTYKSLRQKTLSPDAVERVRKMRHDRGYRSASYYSEALYGDKI